MTAVLWRWAERTLSRHVPQDRVSAVLGDLEEDFAEQVRIRGSIRAVVWLIRETRSVSRAYARARLDDRASRIMLRDELTHACRALTARPSAPIACASLLALAIGLFTAMFSVIDSLVLRPAPFEGAERLLEQTFARVEPDLLAAWEESGLFDAVEAARPFQATFENSAGRRVVGALVTPGLFSMLGVKAEIGRTFPAPASPDEVVLSENVWRSVFGADPTLIGRRIRLDGESVHVVGIMPSTFRFPTPATTVWRPLDLNASPRITTIYGRTRPGVSWAEVVGRLEAIARQSAYIPRNYRGVPPIHAVASSRLSEHTRQATGVLMVGVTLVFLVLSANVVVLLLSRLVQRHRELATCAALGASRARLLRQIVLEHTLIAMAGMGASLAVTHVLTSLLPSHFVGQTLNVVDLDERALIVALIVSFAAVLIAGVVPAWVGTDPAPAQALRRADTSGSPSVSRVTTQGLLVAQIALATALLMASSLFVRSFVNLVMADRGLDVAGVVRVRITNADAAFPSATERADAAAILRDEVNRWPEVATAAISREIPPVPASGGEAHVEGLDGYRVSAEFFSMYGVTILSGQVFRAEADSDEVILSERLAGMAFPGGQAIGEVFRWPGTRPRRVVAIARDITLPALDPASDKPEFYLPLGTSSRTLYLNLRCPRACPAAETIQQRIRRLHPALGATIVQPGELPFATQLELPSAIAQVSGTFGIIALLTASCGLYSVLTFIMRRRRREFGIRQMLGASPADIRRLVLRQGTLVVACGTAIGIIGGWVVSRSLSTFLYGVALLDPLTWTAPLVLLAAASLGAMWLPCRTAAYVNPVTLVREE